MPWRLMAGGLALVAKEYKGLLQALGSCIVDGERSTEYLFIEVRTAEVSATCRLLRALGDGARETEARRQVSGVDGICG